MGLQCVQLEIKDKFGKQFEDTGYNGSSDWDGLHSIASNIGCAFCRAKGIRLIRGLHDSVNLHLDKSVQFPKDLHFLHRHVGWSVAKLTGKKMRCSLCS